MATLEQIDHRVTHIDTRVLIVENQIKHLATKEDLAKLRTELKTDIGNVKFDLLKWLVPIMLGQTAAVFAAARFWSG